MTGDAWSVDELLRAATGDPRPPEEIVERGRRVLVAAIHEETARPATVARRTWSPRWAVAGVILTLVAALVVTGVVVAPQPVTALAQLAEVAEKVTVPVPSEGEYLFTSAEETVMSMRSGSELGLPALETAAYLLPTSTLSWSDGAMVHEEMTVGHPVFFSPEVEAAYEASGLAEEEQVGEVIVSDYEVVVDDLSVQAWPTEAEELRDAMAAYVSGEGSAVPEEARIIDLAANLLREGREPAEVRAAVLRVLDSLEGVTVTEAGDIVTVAVEYADDLGVPTRTELRFDRESRLVGQSVVWPDGFAAVGAPPGTPVYEARYVPAQVVDSLDVP